MKRITPTLGLCLALLAATNLSATALHDWQFNDPAGTPMSGTINQGTAGVAWDGNLANSSTTGTGIFRIQRSGNLVSRRADMGGTDAATHLHMVAEIAGWDMSVVNESVTNELRWELLNGTAEAGSTQVTAAFRMVFLANGQVTLETGAGGTGATRRQAEPVFTLTQTEPVTIALAYNMIQQTYVVQYRVGAGSWIEFFNGDVAPDRMPTSFRLAIRGDFNGGGENYFDLDRFVISTVFPPLDDEGQPTQLIATRLPDGSGLRLVLANPVPGFTYQLQQSTNLAGWGNLGVPVIAGENEIVWEVNPQPFPRFYRAAIGSN